VTTARRISISRPGLGSLPEASLAMPPGGRGGFAAAAV
jgi:hypothetical protein